MDGCLIVWFYEDNKHTFTEQNHMYISRVIINVLTSSVLYLEYEHRSGEIKDYKIGICYFSSKHAALKE